MKLKVLKFVFLSGIITIPLTVCAQTSPASDEGLALIDRDELTEKTTGTRVIPTIIKMHPYMLAYRFAKYIQKKGHKDSPFEEFDREELVSRFGQDARHINRLSIIDPPEGPDNNMDRTTLIFVIHGTWARTSTLYAVDGTPFYTAMQKFAHTIAQQHKNPVHMISLGWSGENSHRARKDAAKSLINIIVNHYSDTAKVPSIITLSHSHGCNAVNIASHGLKAKGISFDTLFHFAPPVRTSTSPLYEPVDVKNIYNFYGHEDAVQTIGSISLHTDQSLWQSTKVFFGWSTKSPRKLKDIKSSHTIVKNFIVQVNGQDVGHGQIKDVAPYLNEIIEKSGLYKVNNDFRLNVITDPQADHTIIITIKHPLPIDDVSPQKKEIYEKELQLSEKGKQLYKTMYGRPIHQKPPVIKRAWRYIARPFSPRGA